MKAATSEFELLGLSRAILRGVFAYGYHTPAPIQKQAIPSLIAGRHAVIQSKNGTGKTATFLLGSLQRVDPQLSDKHVQVLVLSPTRDLALQTASVLAALAKFTAVKSLAAVGGQAIGDDLKQLAGAGCQLLCGTPGRVLQLLKEKPGLFAQIKTVVLDEADQTLAVAAGVPVSKILEELQTRQPQFVFVSATLPESVKQIFRQFAPNADVFLVQPEELSVAQISQQYVILPEKEKFDMVCTIFSQLSISQAVIFVNTKDTAVALEQQLRTHEFPVTALHSDLSQLERNQRLASFFASKYRILISTDLASRGLDAAYVNLVINYDLPQTSEEYLHRIGRGGRFGKLSTAVTLVSTSEAPKLRSMTGAFGCTPQLFSPPGK